MSSTSGIGAAQQALSLPATASPKEISRTDEAKQASASLGATQNDTAELSSASGVLLRAASGSDARTVQLEAIQQAIAAGTYSVSASAVADKLIESMGG